MYKYFKHKNKCKYIKVESLSYSFTYKYFMYIGLKPQSPEFPIARKHLEEFYIKLTPGEVEWVQLLYE